MTQYLGMIGLLCVIVPIRITIELFVSNYALKAVQLDH